jgi:uncharacterized membrane protein YhaH (DUF805 family)
MLPQIAVAGSAPLTHSGVVKAHELIRGHMSKPAMSDLFTFSGRRNRKSYVFYILIVIVISISAAFVITLLAAILPVLAVIAGLLVFLPIMVSSWAVGGQRCRDFGWTGWAVLLTAVPYIGIVAAIAFMVVPGTIGTNRYGRDLLDAPVY